MPTPPVPPHIPTGQELYDAIMQHIEPELVTTVAPTLLEKYKDETPDNRAARMQRYELAFERCDKAYEEYMQTLDAQVNRYRRESFTHAELEDRSADEQILGNLDSLLGSATA